MKSLNQLWKNVTLYQSTISLVCLLAIASPVFAQYRPPSSGSPPRSHTTTTGRRGGCSGDASTTLTAIAPQTHVGQTISTHPTFVWFVPNGEVGTIEFYLNESGAGNEMRPVYQKTNIQSRSGMMSLTLPSDQPGLQPGRTYSWTIALLCNPNHPSSALVAKANLEVVATPPALQPSSSITNPVEQARLYAENGFWYDAIQAALSVSDTQLLSSLIRDLIQSENSTENADQIGQLQQIMQQL